MLSKTAHVFAVCIVLFSPAFAKADQCKEAHDIFEKQAFKTLSPLEKRFLKGEPPKTGVEGQRQGCEDYRQMLADERKTLTLRRAVDRACGSRVHWDSCDTACAVKKLEKSVQKTAYECDPARVAVIQRKIDAEKKEAAEEEKIAVEQANRAACERIAIRRKGNDVTAGLLGDWPSYIKSCNAADTLSCNLAWLHLEETGLATDGLACPPSQETRTEQKRIKDKELASYSSGKGPQENDGACIKLLGDVSGDRRSLVEKCNPSYFCDGIRQQLQIRKENTEGLTCALPAAGAQAQPEPQDARVANCVLRGGMPEGCAAAARSGPAAAKPAPAADCAQAETHWKTAVEIKSAAAYQDHLARFPNCAFAGLAKLRIEQFEPSPPPGQAPANTSPKLASVVARGSLRCGSSGTSAGFSSPDANGVWRGLDVDFCRAVAAAIFNDPAKVEFVPLTFKDGFGALQEGIVDVLARGVARNAERERDFGVRLGATNYHDGTAFMLRKSLKVNSVNDLSGAIVCAVDGPVVLQQLADFRRVKFSLTIFATISEAMAAYEAERCDTMVSDASALYDIRQRLREPKDHIILPEMIATEEHAPAVRQGDEGWLAIVTWTHYAMVAAEELGVTQANVDAARQSSDPAVLRLLGRQGPYGNISQLSDDWAYRVIKHVGNYGEVFQRYFGPGSPLERERGANALVRDGGRQQVPAIGSTAIAK